MTTEQQWEVIATPTRRFSAFIKVDGEMFEDVTFAPTLQEARKRITHCWTLPEYDSESFEILDIKETNK